jgi:hypothetical protein
MPVTDIQTVSLNGVAAPHVIASAIHGAGEPATLEHAGYTCEIQKGNEFYELSFSDADGKRPLWATVTIEKEKDRPAIVTHSSSSSSGTLPDVAATARVLYFAVEVAAILNGWAQST